MTTPKKIDLETLVLKKGAHDSGMTSMYIGPTQPVVPIRTEYDLLVSIAGLLEELLAEVRRSNSTERTGAVSSVQIEDAAKGSPRVTTKAYTGSVVPVEEALEAHALAHREAERRALDGWAETVAELAGGRVA